MLGKAGNNLMKGNMNLKLEFTKSNLSRIFKGFIYIPIFSETISFNINTNCDTFLITCGLKIYP